MTTRPKIAISSCMTGNPVRHNGSHTLDRWLMDELNKYVDFEIVCPEMEMGMGVPREEIHLVYNKRYDKDLMLYKKFSKENITELAISTYEKLNKQLFDSNIDGYILMRKSPSCGLSNVKTVSLSGDGPVRLLPGFYGRNIMSNFPHIPLEESGKIRNGLLREHFVKAVFAHFRLSNTQKKTNALQDFHRRYKYILMEHDQNALRNLGDIVANRCNKSIDTIYADYKALFMDTIKKEATVENRCNTLMHLMGYFKKHLTKDEKQEMLMHIHDYSEGHEHYMVPVRLLQYFVGKYKVAYLADQYYFTPYPKELKLHKEL